MTEDTQRDVSRRNFIKGVIATGAAVSSAAYVFRGGSLLGQQPSMPGSVERLLTLTVNVLARCVIKKGSYSFSALVRETGYSGN